MQPKCDTYRINAPRAFPFLPLSVVEDGNNFDLIIKVEGKFIKLSISIKPYDTLSMGLSDRILSD
jgi:hypothetical protein